jgi:DNA-binding Xre family transcriptional regulator
VTSREGSAPQLHEVEPREQVGAGTGEKYDFQYHEAAADALLVLDDTKVACVYCEWHDDYVIETAGVLSYRFNQVKTRSASQGPWTLNEFFGVKRAKGKKPKNGPPRASATTDSIFGRLLDHVTKFGDRCEWFVFVTDVGMSSDFETLLDDVRTAADQNGLAAGVADEFVKLHAALVTAFPKLNNEELFRFLKRLYVRPALGKLGDLKSCRTLIGGRIHELSEVDLTMSEAQKIAAELVGLVRDKSHRKLPSLPATNADLRATKGLVLEDVLRILSLSSAGYRELKATGRQSVVTLSRLHRLCKRCGVTDTLIPEFCRLKAAWDAWWIGQRHAVNQLDFIALKTACGDALQVHSAGQLHFNGLHAEAKALATKYGPVLTTTEPLNDQLVFGLMMALAAETEQ